MRSRASETEKQYGVFLEVDKVLVDAHNSVHRVAFNMAFKEMGFKNTQWSPEVFWQLMRSSAATPLSLVQTYYNTLGWPTSVPASSRQDLVERIQAAKDVALHKMVISGDLSLRTGVRRFVNEAKSNGAHISLIASTCSATREHLVDGAMSALSDELGNQVRIFQCPQSGTPNQDEGDLPPEERMTLEQSLQRAAAKKRQEQAEDLIEFVNRSKLGADWKQKTAASEPGQLVQRHVGEGMMIDPSLLATRQRFAGLSAAWLSACAATTGISLKRTALLSGTNSLLSAGKGCGMLSVAVPSGYSGRGTYPSADAVMDSFGSGGGVTWSWLTRKIDSETAGKPRRVQHNKRW